MAFKEEDFTRGLDDVVVRKSVNTYVNKEDSEELKSVTKDFHAEPERSKDATVIRGDGVFADRDVREAHTDAGRVPKFENEGDTVASNIGSLDREPAETDQDKPVEAPESDSNSDNVPEGTVDEVNAWVDGDADRAQRALDAENTRKKPRKSLIEDLNNVLDGE